MRTYLVIGGAGFIGSNYIHYIIAGWKFERGEKYTRYPVVILRKISNWFLKEIKSRLKVSCLFYCRTIGEEKGTIDL